MNNNPIGIFDSGIGGTSIWSAIHSLLPYENTIYLADSNNAPYGLKSTTEIKQLCFKNTELLLKHNCKLIVVACNTATTNAIAQLREQYNVPFIGIEPAIKPASFQSKTNKIGILATEGTLNSKLFHATMKKHVLSEVIEQVGHGLVEMIEEGKINSTEMRKLLESYLNPMIKQNIDYLVLGCSHYPYLTPIIKSIIPNHIQIIDSGEAVAKQTKRILENQSLISDGKKLTNNKFYTNGDKTVLQSILKDIPRNKIELLNF